MKREVIVVGSGEEAAGFRLAGVGETHEPSEEGLADKLTGREAVILVSEDGEKALESRMDDIRSTSVVQRIPSEAYNGLGDIVKNTIGFELRG